MEAFWPHRSSGNGRVSTRGPLRHNFIIPERKLKVRFKHIPNTGTHYCPDKQCCESGSGIRCLSNPLDPGSGMGKNSGSGSGMNNPDHIFESLETFYFLGKNTYQVLIFFDADLGSGMEKNRIRDVYPRSAALLISMDDGILQGRLKKGVGSCWAASTKGGKVPTRRRILRPNKQQDSTLKLSVYCTTCNSWRKLYGGACYSDNNQRCSR
jgi:hypothetical protein